MMRPAWLARWICSLRGHSLVLLNHDDDELDPGEQADVPIICDRCWTLGTVTLLRVE